jgi:hypothetical protein
MAITNAGNIGVWTIAPSNFFDIERAGTVTSTIDFLEITNTATNAAMTATGTGILWNQWYFDGVTPAVADAGRIAFVTEGNWTSVAGTQASSLILSTCLAGAVASKVWIDSRGYLGVGATPDWILDLSQDGTTVYTLAQATNVNSTATFRFGVGGSAVDNVPLRNNAFVMNAGNSSLLMGTNDISKFIITNAGYVGINLMSSAAAAFAPSAFLDIQQAGTAKATVDFLEITNSVNAADMDATGTAILFNQFAYDAAVPAVADSGRIAVITEQDWTTADLTTQDSYMSFQTALNGTVGEKARIDSNGTLLVGVMPAALNAFHKLVINGTGDGEVARFQYLNGAGASTLIGFTYRDAANNISPVKIGYICETFTDNTYGSFVVKTRIVDTNTEPLERVRVTSTGGMVYTPTSTQNIVAATGITTDMLKHIIRIQGSGGAVTITATPSIAGALDGQIMIFQGMSDANTVTFQDESSLANVKLQLDGGANCTLGLYDTLTLMYDSNLGYFIELGRSNN